MLNLIANVLNGYQTYATWDFTIGLGYRFQLNVNTILTNKNGKGGIFRKLFQPIINASVITYEEIICTL